MLIAGGLYREICEVPVWNALFGSGGRAAAAVSVLSPDSKLYTYVAPVITSDIVALEQVGVRIVGSTTKTAIAFAYFHPLSRPYIEPAINKIVREAPLHVRGDTVLRFGFVEGEAIVEAERAVYDPQTCIAPELFRANGSQAHQLAVVLNESELRRVGHAEDLFIAAQAVMDKEGAAVVIAKGGATGATVYEADGRPTHIPAYRSARVFKIGTGDIFSAIFAHYWGEADYAPGVAADLASRAVAAYCDSRSLPIQKGAGLDLHPVATTVSGSVLLLGSPATMGGRWMMEEARWCLRELGAEVICPALNGRRSPHPSQYVFPGLASSVLCLLDDGDVDVKKVIQSTESEGIPVVLFSERARPADELLSQRVITDFATAIYFAVWAAAIRS